MNDETITPAQFKIAQEPAPKPHPLHSPVHAGMSTVALARAKAGANGLTRQKIDFELAIRAGHGDANVKRRFERMRRVEPSDKS